MVYWLTGMDNIAFIRDNYLHKSKDFVTNTNHDAPNLNISIMLSPVVKINVDYIQVNSLP